MRRLINACRRSAAKWRIRSLETTLAGQNECLEHVRDRETRLCIESARQVTRRELATARAEYIALLPSGERKTWAAA